METEKTLAVLIVRRGLKHSMGAASRLVHAEACLRANWGPTGLKHRQTWRRSLTRPRKKL